MYYFGIPHCFLSNDGDEFNNDYYRQMNGKLNIVSGATAAESPFSNGTLK